MDDGEQVLSDSSNLTTLEVKHWRNSSSLTKCFQKSWNITRLSFTIINSHEKQQAKGGGDDGIHLLYLTTLGMPSSIKNFINKRVVS